MSKEINIVQIQTALLLPVTAQFIVEKLGVKPVRQEKRAMYWKAEDFTHVCQGRISHITAVRNADFDQISGQRPKKVEPEPAADSGDFFGEAAPAAAPATEDEFFGASEAKAEEAEDFFA
jgi:hypothetical protein